MRNVLINTWAITGVTAVAVSASLYASVVSGDPGWFARAGSVVTVLGLLLLIKHSVLCAGMDLEDAMMEKLHYRRERSPPSPGSSRYLAELAHTRRILLDEFLGFGITLFGTVIWGFGDLLVAPLL